MFKVKPPSEYPPEEGGYRGVEKMSFLRGNDFSPVAVVAILDTFDYLIPPEIEQLVKVSIEAGAALAGMLQTENVGIEKIIANIVAKPNIRYIILCWRESQGHLPGDALVALMKNGVEKDKKRTIIGSKAPTPYLPNIPIEAIERFRKQVTIINLLSEDDPRIGMDQEMVKKAVWSCCQKKPTKFMDYTLYDPGAYPEPPIYCKITWRIIQPWKILDEEEARIIERIREAARVKGREQAP